nr:immunoglobulin light chain junction region [Macaca mulatta]
CQRDYSWPLTF